MKNLALIIFLSIIGLTSCRKVIDLQLNDSEAQFVLKGEVNAGDSIHTLSITKTISFNQDNVFPGVTGAFVVLSDDLGNSQTLNDLGDGKYATTNFPASTGRTYTFTVTTEGNTFTAQSNIPEIVPLLNIDFLPSSFFGDTGFVMIPKYLDPVGIKNFYLYYFYNKNNPKDNSGSIINDDAFSDGKVNQQPFFGNWSPNTGDTVIYMMYGIDQPVYEYYFSFAQNTSGNTGAPANPVSNWSGNALGYFTAQNVQALEVIVP